MNLSQLLVMALQCIHAQVVASTRSWTVARRVLPPHQLLLYLRRLRMLVVIGQCRPFLAAKPCCLHQGAPQLVRRTVPMQMDGKSLWRGTAPFGAGLALRPRGRSQSSANLRKLRRRAHIRAPILALPPSWQRRVHSQLLRRTALVQGHQLPIRLVLQPRFGQPQLEPRLGQL
jgi:hypothetical protein